MSSVALVLAGGVGLGAYQAGAYEAMSEPLRERLGWLAGASIGAVNAALIAGSPPEQRVDALARFWDEAAAPVGMPAYGTSTAIGRHALSWMSVAQSRMFGQTGLFAPRGGPGLFIGQALALYGLAPLARKLERRVDFERLNSGEMRVSVIATDLDTGEAVVFDTQAGDVIGPEHLLASCGFLPDFDPTEIDGRLLGDGALVANAPVELVLANQAGDEDLICFVIDPFARDIGRPTSMERSAELRRDLLLSNPTHRALDALRREDALRRLLATAVDQMPPGMRNGGAVAPLLEAARRGRTTVLHLSYHSSPTEAGPEKQFDFSRASLSGRRQAGADDMRRAIELLEQDEAGGRSEAAFVLHRVRR